MAFARFALLLSNASPSEGFLSVLFGGLSCRASSAATLVASESMWVSAIVMRQVV